MPKVRSRNARVCKSCNRLPKSSKTGDVAALINLSQHAIEVGTRDLCGLLLFECLGSRKMDYAVGAAHEWFLSPKKGRRADKVLTVLGKRTSPFKKRLDGLYNRCCERMSNSKVTTTTKLEADMWLTQMALDRSLQRSLLVEKVILEKFDELTNLLSNKVEEQLTLAMIIALNKKQRT
jgi:hypothetical protein